MHQHNRVYVQSLYVQHPAFNPGYIGSTQAYSLNLLQRNQWVGFEGAPVSKALSFSTPVQSKDWHMKPNAINDKIGPIINNSFAADLAYHLVLNGNDNILSLGMKFSLNSYNIIFQRLESQSN